MADEARKLGGRVHVMWTDTVKGPEDMPPSVVRAFESPDVTIFNHMIAGVLRMVPFNGRGMKMLNFLQTWDQLGSPFAQVPYKVWLEVLKNLGPALAWQSPGALPARSAAISAGLSRSPASRPSRTSRRRPTSKRPATVSRCAPSRSASARCSTACRRAGAWPCVG